METLQRTANRGSISTDTSYNIDNSLMFSTSGAYADSNSRFYHLMNPGGDDNWAATSTNGTNARKVTVSIWFKRAALTESSHYPRLFDYRAGGVAFSVYLTDSNKLKMYDDNTSMSLESNMVFRDTSAWSHLVVAIDQTQSTASNRVKAYVNGEQITSWGTEDYGNQNVDLSCFRADSVSFHVGGAANDAGAYFNGYIAEYNFIDGQQLAPTEFGKTDSDSGIWIPKEFTGSYGILGHYYNFSNASSIGEDFSGNDNDANNRGAGITNGSARQATDTPTNNFCTLNLQVPNYVNTGGAKDGGTFIDWGQNSYGAWFGTQGVKKGKWFWEFYVPSRSATYGLMHYIGLHTLESKQFANGNTYATAGSNTVFWLMHYGDYYATTNGSLTSQNTEAGLASEGTGAIGRTFGVAFNADDAEITFYNNGSVTGNAGIDVYDIDESMAAGTFVFPFFQVYDNDLNVNFGGYSSIAISSGNSDANGYGNFEYAVPNGYYSLCTKNLAEFG